MESERLFSSRLLALTSLLQVNLSKRTYSTFVPAMEILLAPCEMSVRPGIMGQNDSLVRKIQQMMRYEGSLESVMMVFMVMEVATVKMQILSPPCFVNPSLKSCYIRRKKISHGDSLFFYLLLSCLY